MKRRHCIILLLGLVLLLTGCYKEKSKSARTVNTSSDNGAQALRQSVPSNTTLVAMVVGITDGDTVVVLDSADRFNEIRLKGIDAPELRQAFGDASRVYLARKLAGKEVAVESQKRDRYGRLIGKVSLDGRDICLEQIEAGLAWHYKKFENEQNEADQNLYAEAEQYARSQRLGLWRESTQIPPWDFRLEHSR
jgi:endonuclease YncB( thermonuclease family)